MTQHNLAIQRFLLFVIGLVFVMVWLGGITRLTHSGLSIVDWKPFMGVFPPTRLEEWQQVFERYQSYPEYRLLRPDMTLAEFKEIYWWEYAHRLFGRFIGVAYFLPLAFFWLKGWLSRELKIKLFIGFALGGLQGLIGWFMVQSGLIQNPHVSHFRLAIHLCLALFVMVYLFWIYLDLKKPARNLRPNFAWLIFCFFLIQVVYGAFTAGLHAGHMYGTFPLMRNEFFPSELLLGNGLLSWFQERPNIQWIHRWLGVCVGLATIGWWTFRIFTRSASLSTHLLVVGTTFQVLLGISTLVLHVPVRLASSHQLLAVGILLVWIVELRNSLKAE